ncbi:MAG TPA: DUF1275 domain-containing protein [Leptolyngbyaceae cyanobacterium M33_DOE_097]|uniref:DUF1275 domain-containing protein n=1 Tax=Oscillatoriales cyanobacterium SpSt-418 TaxID=2282169 RepID=A0A7C3KBE4_9CYAN|nr:DUF1275 domain-containing protein [Leptolyngbyaceae cyanobacterium M33_DOE_097]
MSQQLYPLPLVLVVLTITTGLVDAVSVLGLGRVFTANMTGNIVFLGFAVAGTPGLSVPLYLVSIAGFLVGAALGGRFGLIMANSLRRRWLLAIALIETGLFFGAALFAIGYDIKTLTPTHHLYAMIILTAIAMGLRNATVRRLAVPDLTTTVLTLTVTAIAAESAIAGGSNPRLGRRLASVLSIFAGGAIGALLVSQVGLAPPLILAGASILIATLVYAIHPASKTISSNTR